MQIGKYIHAKLTGAAPVAAIAANRVYPVFLPTPTPPDTIQPSVVYMVQSEPHGSSKVDEGTHIQSTVSLHLWADVSQGQLSYATLEDLDAAIYDALTYVEGTAGGVTVESCRHLGTDDGRDDNNLFFLKTAKYMIVHRR